MLLIRIWGIICQQTKAGTWLCLMVQHLWKLPESAKQRWQRVTVISWLNRYKNDTEVNKSVSHATEGWVRSRNRTIVTIRGCITLFIIVDSRNLVNLASDHTINKKQKKTKPSVTVWGWLDYTCTCTGMHVPAWSFLETHCLTYTKYWTWAKLWKWQSYNKNILLVIDPCIISMDRIGENQHENVKDPIQVEHIWIIIEKNLVSWPWSVHVSVCKISCGFPIIFDIWWAFVIFNIFSHCCIFIQVSN